MINAVDVDDYVKGVVPLESPASWPIEALKAQAVAARTYALTTSKGGTGWDHYTDTRSQVYGGVGAEQASTNAAVDATAGQLVTYNGEPVATYFFSTSGGRTEDVENTSLGTAPMPWLKSVRDKYDSVSPRHRWGPIRMGRATAGAKLSRAGQGALPRHQGRQARPLAAHRGREHHRHGRPHARRRRDDPRAPRSLRHLGLLHVDQDRHGAASRRNRPGRRRRSDPGTGGTSPGAATAGTRPAGGLRGSVMPGRRGARITLQRRVGGRWVTIGTVRAGAGGRYEAAVAAAGTYRVRYRGDAGPAVRIG